MISKAENSWRDVESRNKRIDAKKEKRRWVKKLERAE